VVGATLPATPFISFNNGGITTGLEIDFIPPGFHGTAGCSASPPAAGQVCTPAGSPFSLQNFSATTSIMIWQFSGILDDSGIPWTGVFSSAFVTLPYQGVLAQIAVSGFVEATFSGLIVIPAPEPGTLPSSALGAAMLLSAAVLRRRLNARAPAAVCRPR
jgi:hypothetical protein